MVASTDDGAPPALDPDFIASAVAHMNEDHRDAILAYAQAFGGARWATDARLEDLDAFGMQITVIEADRRETCRVAFPDAPIDAPAIRRTLVEMARDARARLATDGSTTFR